MGILELIMIQNAFDNDLIKILEVIMLFHVNKASFRIFDQSIFFVIPS